MPHFILIYLIFNTNSEVLQRFTGHFLALRARTDVPAEPLSHSPGAISFISASYINVYGIQLAKCELLIDRRSMLYLPFVLLFLYTP
jgi:hypothetical protein